VITSVFSGVNDIVDHNSVSHIYKAFGTRLDMCLIYSIIDIHVLKEAGAEKADIILCFMRGEADNIALALLSKSLGIPRIIARMRDPHYEQAHTQAGVTTIMSVADLLINQIMAFTIHMSLE
jgi:Trk K+ transport system NAD-binding subunit